MPFTWLWPGGGIHLSNHSASFLSFCLCARCLKCRYARYDSAAVPLERAHHGLRRLISLIARSLLAFVTHTHSLRLTYNVLFIVGRLLIVPAALYLRVRCECHGVCERERARTAAFDDR